MKWFRFFCLGCLASGAAFGAAAGGEKGSPKTAEKKAAVANLSMIASIPHISTAGSPINVKFTVENNGKDDLRYFTRTKYLDYGLEVTGPMGMPVPMTRFGRANYGDYREAGGSGYFLTLSAGKSVAVTLNIARIFDLTEEGEYSVSISREFRGPDGRINARVEKIAFKVVGEGR